MGRRDLEFRVRLAAEGGTQAANEIAKIQREIQNTRAGVAGFQQLGGLAALTDRNNQLSPAAQRVDALTQRIQHMRAEIDGVRQLGGLAALTDGNTQISETVRRVEELIQRIERLQAEIEGTRGNIKVGVAAATPTLAAPQTPAQFGRISDIDSSLRIIGTALGRFDNETLDQAAAFATIVGDVAAVSEAAPRLALGISQIASNISAAIASTTGEIVAKTASTAATQKATVSEVGLTASRSKAAVGLAGAAAAFAGVAVALGAVHIAAADTRKEMERVIGALETRIDVERRLRDLSAEGGRARINELNQNIQQEIEARDALIAATVEQLGEMSNLELGLTGIGNVIGVVGTGANDAKSAIDAYNTSIREQEQELKQIQAVIDARSFVSDLREQLLSEQELQNLRLEASAEEVQQLIKDAEDRKAIESGVIEATREEIARLQEFLSLGFASSGAKIAELEAALQTAITARNDESRIINRLTGDVIRHADAREAELKAIEEAEEALEKSMELRREEAKEVIRIAEEVVAERERQLDELDKLNNQIADSERDFARTRARRAEEEALQASQDERKANLDARLDAAKMQDALVQVRERGSERQIQITENLVKQQTKALDDRNAQISKINTNFMRSELREIEDFNRKRQRLEEDLAAGLLEAATENDVSRFISLRSQAVTQLRRGDEDFGVERDRAGQDRDQAIADIESRFRAESAARQQAAQEQLTQVRNEQQQQTDTITNAGRQRLTLIEQLEQEGARLQKVFADEKKAQTLRFEQDAHNERIAQLQKQAMILQRELGMIDQGVSQNMSIMAKNAGNAMLAGFAAAVGAAQMQNITNVTAPINTSLTFGSGISAQQAEQIAMVTTQSAISGLGAVFRRRP